MPPVGLHKLYSTILEKFKVKFIEVGIEPLTHRFVACLNISTCTLVLFLCIIGKSTVGLIALFVLLTYFYRLPNDFYRINSSFDEVAIFILRIH